MSSTRVATSALAPHSSPPHLVSGGAGRIDGTVIVFGAAGCGKSTLLNQLWRDLCDGAGPFTVCNVASKDGTVKCEIRDCSVMDEKSGTSRTYRLTDTPGLNSLNAAALSHIMNMHGLTTPIAPILVLPKHTTRIHTKEIEQFHTIINTWFQHTIPINVAWTFGGAPSDSAGIIRALRTGMHGMVCRVSDVTPHVSTEMKLPGLVWIKQSDALKPAVRDIPAPIPTADADEKKSAPSKTKNKKKARAQAPPPPEPELMLPVPQVYDPSMVTNRMQRRLNALSSGGRLVLPADESFATYGDACLSFVVYGVLRSRTTLTARFLGPDTNLSSLKERYLSELPLAQAYDRLPQQWRPVMASHQPNQALSNHSKANLVEATIGWALVTPDHVLFKIMCHYVFQPIVRDAGGDASFRA